MTVVSQQRNKIVEVKTISFSYIEFTVAGLFGHGQNVIFSVYNAYSGRPLATRRRVRCEFSEPSTFISLTPFENVRHEMPVAIFAYLNDVFGKNYFIHTGRIFIDLNICM